MGHRTSRRNFKQRMQQYPIIFSNERKYKWRRHLLFWASWWLFSTILYSFSPSGMELGYWKKLLVSSVDAVLFMLAHIFLSYSLIYFVVPRMVLKKKYALAVLTTIGLFLATAAISAVISIYIIGWFWFDLMVTQIRVPKHVNYLLFFNALLGGLRGAITIGGIAAAIKLMKHWYMESQNRLELQKQNVETQLELLKAQVHPHFLFNTLNNIYAHTQVASPEAPRLVAGLSDMLRYMLYECNVPLVPLQKELKMVQDYILLEQVRYNQQLDISLDIAEVDESLHVAPLLLLPFVENAFKHGTSQMLEHPWISLHISAEGNELKMKLVNGKAEAIRRSASGIGIANVRKRLELLYPGRHQLRITQSEDAFIVNLKLELERSRCTKTSASNSSCI
jgi:sensor histidine kinase YesM